ncbi:MAG: hypothetical protein HUU48_12130 [Flavobacteriales bacterium]|nr:hypothetical protein [Flavobacteriales bacterium]
MDIITSPFSFGKKISKLIPNLQAVEAHRLKNNFQQKINTVLTGSRAVGKSSLVENVFSNFNNLSFYRCVFVDVLKCRNSTDFYNFYLSKTLNALLDTKEEKLEWLKKIQPLLSAQANIIISDQGDSFQINTNPQQSLSLLDIPEQIAKQKNFLLYICVENAEEFFEMENNLEWLTALRETWDKQQKCVHCLLMNTKESFYELVKNKNAPFFHFADEITISSLSVTDELLQYLMTGFAYSGKTISKELAARLAYLVGGNPYYLKMLAHSVWENTKGSVSEEIISASLNELVARQHTFFKKEFSGLSAVQKKLVLALAENPDAKLTSYESLKKFNINSSAALVRAYQGLEKKEIIDAWSEKPLFLNPLFKYWLLDFMIKQN